MWWGRWRVTWVDRVRRRCERKGQKVFLVTRRMTGKKGKVDEGSSPWTDEFRMNNWYVSIPSDANVILTNPRVIERRRVHGMGPLTKHERITVHHHTEIIGSYFYPDPFVSVGVWGDLSGLTCLVSTDLSIGPMGLHQWSSPVSFGWGKLSRRSLLNLLIRVGDSQGT